MALKLDPGQAGHQRNGHGTSQPPNGQPLPLPFRHQMEALFAADLSSVRVYQGHQATHVGAVAFAQGEHIHFAPGRYDPTSAAGQQLLGHELAHVIQQRDRATNLTVPRGMVDVELEAEAEE